MNKGKHDHVKREGNYKVVFSSKPVYENGFYTFLGHSYESFNELLQAYRLSYEASEKLKSIDVKDLTQKMIYEEITKDRNRIEASALYIGGKYTGTVGEYIKRTWCSYIDLVGCAFGYKKAKWKVVIKDCGQNVYGVAGSERDRKWLEYDTGHSCYVTLNT